MGAGAGRVLAAGAAAVFLVVACARAGMDGVSAAPVSIGAAVRLRAAGFTVCSWLARGGAGAALSVFARLVERLRVVAGFACTFASGDSDVLFIKKTPFYRLICHAPSRPRLQVARDADGDGNFSSHSHIKRTVPS